MKGIMHVHTRNSIDGANSLEGIYRWCISHQVKFIAVTDHDNIEASLAFKDKYGQEILSIPGAEYSTTIGHLLVLFLTTGLETLLTVNHQGLFEIEDLLHEAHKQKALIVAAHPKHIEEKYLKRLHGLEVFNGRVLDPERNQKALALAKKHHLLMFGGADAHLPGELSQCLLEVEGSPKSLEALQERLMEKGLIQITCRTGNYHYSARTQLLKQYRRGRLGSRYSLRQVVKIIISPFFWLKKRRHQVAYQYDIFPREEQ